jgi:hypothetical protein
VVPEAITQSAGTGEGKRDFRVAGPSSTVFHWIVAVMAGFDSYYFRVASKPARAVETNEANAFVRRPRSGIPYLTPRFRGGR